MHPLVAGAVDRDTRAIDLGQPVDVKQFDTELVADPRAHPVAPAFRADDPLFERDFIRQTAFLHLFRQQ